MYMIVLYASILFDHSIKESDSKGKPIVTWVKRTAHFNDVFHTVPIIIRISA